jgi:hypothetical protein
MKEGEIWSPPEMEGFGQAQPCYSVTPYNAEAIGRHRPAKLSAR